jgi:histidyl-tRNA synthetase
MKVQILRGFRDLEPAEMLVREQMIDVVKGVFESFGYGPIHTPAMEYAEILTGKYGEEGDKLLYRFEDNGGRDVALRYDLTVPLARFVATHPELRFPFRRYHIAPVWRAERPQKGRFREFYQCDVDLLGVDTPAADAECVLIDRCVMGALGIDDGRIEVNHRGFLDGLLRALGIEVARHVATLRVLDKMDKVSSDEMRQMLVGEGLTGEAAGILAAMGGLPGGNADRLRQCRSWVGDDVGALAALERIEEVLAVVEDAGGSGQVNFNPAVARGLDYYTGIVYETFLPPRFGVGSVMSGGRYNGLIGMFSGRDVPAVGISLGLDRLAAALQASEEGVLRGVSRVLVCSVAGLEADAFRIAHRIRKAVGGRGTGVELFPESGRLKKQFEHANKTGVSWLVLPGTQELERGVVIVKNMESGEQREVALAELEETMASLLGGADRNCP